MKRKVVLCLGILFTIILTGCNAPQNGNTEGTETESQATETETESEEEKPTVSKLLDTYKSIDKSITDVKNLSEAELFYEDEKYEYYFEDKRNASIRVFYEDAGWEYIKTAFSAGRVDIYDLGKEGVVCFVKEKKPEVGAEPKLINIIYTSNFSGVMETGRETLYEDGIYQYYYTLGMSDKVFAYYTDGTRENVKSALEAGRITIEDLQEYGLGGTQVLNVVDVVDLTANGDIQCVQEKEYIYENESYKYYFDCVKSMYIELHYKNGEVETLKEALDAGRITDTAISWLRKNCPDILKRENVPAPVKEIRYGIGEPIVMDIKVTEEKDLIYEDEKYEYYLDSDAAGKHIWVIYENDTQDRLIDAIAGGTVDVYDLMELGISCFVCEKNPVEGTSPKFMYIIDTTWGQYAAGQKIYEDDNYKYYINGTQIEYIHAYYTDGTREPITEALTAGRITIADLDANGIEYSKKEK